MARPLRIEYPGAFYHVINRGHRQEPIALDRQDRTRFLSTLARMTSQYGVLVHSYCLMTNHYHLILETPEGNLSRAMQWLNVSYATHHNRRHRRAGHLFQGRFKAILVDAGAYLESLSRYIHRNPVRAGMASRAWDYAWSSCRYFVGSAKAPDWLEVNRILGGFARSRTVARRRYADYVSEADAPNPFDEVIAGSVLGSERFVQWVKDAFLSARGGDREIPNLKTLRPRPDVEKIVDSVAKHLQTSPEYILARGHKRNRARDIAVYLSRELSGLSCQELGRHFGGVCGAAITMRHRHVTRALTGNRRLARDLARLRRRILNN